jgi:hypothetical protein
VLKPLPKRRQGEVFVPIVIVYQACNDQICRASLSCPRFASERAVHVEGTEATFDATRLVPDELLKLTALPATCQVM